MILVVSYALGPGHSVSTEFYDVLKRQPKWWHYIGSTWLVETDLTSRRLAGELRQFLRKGDRLVVAKLDPKDVPDGWLPKEAWEWINKAYKGPAGS